jgi:hypothetical protein
MSRLSAPKIGGKSTSAFTQQLSRKSFLSGARSKALGTQTKRRDPVSKTPFPSSAAPGSDCSSSGAQGSTMSYDRGPDRADRGPRPCNLDWTESPYGKHEHVGSHTSFACAAHSGVPSQTTTLSIYDSVSGPPKPNTHPQDNSPPAGDEISPLSTEDTSKPPQSSIAISSVGSDVSKDSNGFKMHGQPVFRNLVRMKWSQRKPE